jgi:hypothetical protein
MRCVGVWPLWSEAGGFSSRQLNRGWGVSGVIVRVVDGYHEWHEWTNGANGGMGEWATGFGGGLGKSGI